METEMKKVFERANSYDPTLRADRSENPYASPYYGLWYKTLMIEGEERRVCLYTPQSAFPQLRKLILWLPEKVSAEEFLSESIWAEISERGDLYLMLLESGKNGYSTYETEEKYQIAAEQACWGSMDEEFSPMGCDGIYIAGYGKGADIAVKQGLEHPSKYSSLCVFGASCQDEKWLEQLYDAHLSSFSDAPEWTNSKCPLPVWIGGKAEENEVLLQYAKKINRVMKAAVCTEFGMLYEQEAGVFDNNLNHAPVSRVVLTECEDAENAYKNDTLTNRVYDEMIGRILRFAEDPCGALRPYVEIKEPMFRIFHEKMQHVDFDFDVDRMWIVYAPSSYDGKTPLPLVVATHGYTACYEYYARNTEWWRVAEERNFIVVFTQALPDNWSTCGTPRWRNANITKANIHNRHDKDGALECEINYFRRVVESVKENYNIDPERVYCNGHSNGGQMTYAVSERLTDLFAASAHCGMCVREFESRDEMKEKEIRIPSLNIENGFDRWTDPDDEECPLHSEIEYRLIENGMDPDKTFFTEVDNYRYVTRSYYNKQNIPMVNFMLYKNCCHACFPDMSYIIWDQFLCNFKRTEDGSVYYRGIRVE